MINLTIFFLFLPEITSNYTRYFANLDAITTINTVDAIILPKISDGIHKCFPLKFSLFNREQKFKRYI